jgi:hypothetical protein
MDGGGVFDVLGRCDVSGVVKVTQGVGAILCCSHHDQVRKQLHGHTYEVTAWFSFKESRDALCLQKTLEGALSAWDHTVLPDELASAEGLATAILGLLNGCVEVEVSRPLERLYARARV